MSKKKQVHIRRSLGGEQVENISQELKGEKLFLFNKLTFYCKTNFNGRNNKVTKNSVKPIAELYNKTFEISETSGDHKSNIQKNKIISGKLQNTITGEAIADFFNSENLVEYKSTVNQLAGLVLVLEKVKDKDECLILISSKKAWAAFKENYAEDIRLLVIYSKLAGNYFLLSYDHKPANLIRTPLEIKNNGFFQITCSNGFFEGTIQVTQIGMDSYLHLNIERKKISNNEINFSGYFIFYINQLLGSLIGGGQNAFRFIDALAGVSIRINSDGEPQVKKEFLIPAKNNLFTEENFQKIKFNYLDKGFLNDLKGFGENANIGDDFFKFLARSLRGREGNLIIASKSAYNNTNINRIRDVEYQDLYLNSFLYEVIFPKEKNNSKIYKYLYEALLHGADLRVIESKMKALLEAINVSEKQHDEIFNLITEIKDGITYLYLQGKIEQLIEILTNPQNVIHPESAKIATNIRRFILMISELKKADSI